MESPSPFVIPSRPKIIITNDDGIDADGLSALRAAVETWAEPIIVAPAICWSGCSHRVTYDRPFRVTQRGEGCFVVEGTPADCVRVGLARIAPDAVAVLSGINHGGNLGIDTYYSGTVAAVREAVFMGKPGIAVSQYHRRGVDPLDWPRAVRWVAPVLQDLIVRPLAAGSFWNVNLPNRPHAEPPDIVHCPVDHSPMPITFQIDGEHWQDMGNYHDRERRDGTDIDHCFAGRIAVSLIELR
jgi:5'-nucleotidase